MSLSPSLHHIIQLARAAGMSWPAIAESTGMTLEQVRYAGDLDYRTNQLTRYKNPTRAQKQRASSRRWYRSRKEYIDYLVWCKVRSILGPKADIPHYRDKAR